MDLHTKISYTYRDAENNKGRCSCVINGLLSDEQQKRILDCLFEGEWFIPNVVGLDEERPFEYDPEIDHPFWELGEYSFEETYNNPTVNISAEALVRAFEEYKDKWELLGVEYVPEFGSDFEATGVMDVIQGAIARSDALINSLKSDKDIEMG